MGKVLAVVNQKGGVGKSTTAVNLGACLAELGQKVLIVDLDPQGNASSGLGIDKKRLSASIYQVLLEELPLAEVIQKQRSRTWMWRRQQLPGRR